MILLPKSRTNSIGQVEFGDRQGVSSLDVQLFEECKVRYGMQGTTYGMQGTTYGMQGTTYGIQGTTHPYAITADGALDY